MFNILVIYTFTNINHKSKYNIHFRNNSLISFVICLCYFIYLLL